MFHFYRILKSWFSEYHAIIKSLCFEYLSVSDDIFFFKNHAYLLLLKDIRCVCVCEGVSHIFLFFCILNLTFAWHEREYKTIIIIISRIKFFSNFCLFINNNMNSHYLKKALWSRFRIFRFSSILKLSSSIHT